MSLIESSLGVSSPVTPLLVICTGCNGQNRADRQFCGTCGARLWDPCLKCGRSNASSEKHCGDCGANLADELCQVQAALETRLTEAARLANDHLHPDAIDCLQAIQVADHSALARYRQEAIERIAAVRSEMLRCNRERDDCMARGRELLAACDYEQAAITLEQVAEPYHTDELRWLLDEVRARQIDMLTLVAEIRRAVAEDRTEGLLPSIEALLRLKPNHAQARALAERLRPLEHKKNLSQRDALHKSAKAHLARYDYAAALECLQRIADDVRTPQLRKFIDETQAKAAEAAWLDRDLREAVVYDEHLLAVAERLLKLRTSDEKLTKLIERLRQLQSETLRHKNDKISWPRPPANSIWGPPLEIVTGFQQIDTASLDNAFHTAPDRFCVAAGLALQGLQRGILNVNLVPPEKPGRLGIFKSRKKPLVAAWGIDVGRAALKAIRLVWKPDEDRVVAEAVEYLEHRSLLNAPDADAQGLLGASLDTFLSRQNLRDAVLCVGVPAHKVLYRPVTLPLAEEKKFAELMKFEAREQIPLPIDNVVWGYHLLGHRQTEVTAVRECEVALLALKLDEAQTALAPFAQRGLKVDVLQSAAAALFNFVMFEHAASARDPSPRRKPGVGAPLDLSDLSNVTTDSLPVTIILDIGADSTNLIITNGAALAIRSIPWGGNSLSRTIVNEFHLTFAQAEKVKRNPPAMRELHRLYAALEPRFAELTRELRRTIDGFLQADSARRVTRFVVLGGGLKLHGALRRLWHGA